MTDARRLGTMAGEPRRCNSAKIFIPADKVNNNVRQIWGAFPLAHVSTERVVQSFRTSWGRGRRAEVPGSWALGDSSFSTVPKKLKGW
jgi:hypothetical protein